MNIQFFFKIKTSLLEGRLFEICQHSYDIRKNEQRGKPLAEAL